MNEQRANRKRITVIAALLIAMLAAVFLTGCTGKTEEAAPTDDPAQKEVIDKNDAPTPTPTATPTPTPTPMPTPEAAKETAPPPDAGVQNDQPKKPVVNQVQTGLVAPDNEEQQVTENDPLNYGDVNSALDSVVGIEAGEAKSIDMPEEVRDLIGWGVDDIPKTWTQVQIQERAKELMNQGMSLDDALTQAMIEGGLNP